MAIARPLGQHWTIGHARPPPFIPAPPPSPAPIIPLALLCLLLTLLAIAATIVLSLIPIYTPARGNRANCTSAATPTTFNVADGSLPAGQLTPNNRAALQSGLNNYIATQPEFSRCTLQLNDANVNSCPSTQRLLLSKKRKRRDESSLVRHVRQANNNCASQQIATSSALNCGCRCVGACLRRKVDRLNLFFATIRLTITFPDGIRVTVTIVGINIPIVRQTTTTTTTTISTSTSTSTNTASTSSTSTNTASTSSTSTNTASTSSTSTNTASTSSTSTNTASTSSTSTNTASTSSTPVAVTSSMIG